MNITKNGESRSIPSPTTTSLFLNVPGFERKSPLTQNFLQAQKSLSVTKLEAVQIFLCEGTVTDEFTIQNIFPHYPSKDEFFLNPVS